MKKTNKTKDVFPSIVPHSLPPSPLLYSLKIKSSGLCTSALLVHPLKSSFPIFFSGSLISLFLTLNKYIFNKVMTVYTCPWVSTGDWFQDTPPSPSEDVFSHMTEESDLITKTNKETQLWHCPTLPSSFLGIQMSCPGTNLFFAQILFSLSGPPVSWML